MVASHLLEELAGRKTDFAAGGEFVHLGDDGFDADTIGEAERAATEWCKASAHDHAEIDILGRSNDAFFEATGGFIDHEINHAVAQGFTIEVAGVFTLLNFDGLHVDSGPF